MNLSHTGHLGIAVKSTEEALPFFKEVLGLTCYNIEEVTDQRMRATFLRMGEVKLKLLKPTSDESPIVKFIEKRGGGIHHLTLSSNNVAPAPEELKDKGIRLIDEKPRKGTEGLNTAFVHPRSAHGMLLEICDCKGVAK